MFGSTNRQILHRNQIPAMVSNAMVAAEDKHFYNEGGVSPTGIIRAAIADLTSGSVQQGGSTITQQLVRNYYRASAPRRPPAGRSRRSSSRRSWPRRSPRSGSSPST